VRRTGLHHFNPGRSRAAWRAAVVPHAGRRRGFAFWRYQMLSILVGFGVVTLFATGFLFVAHMLEDFRDA